MFIGVVVIVLIICWCYQSSINLITKVARFLEVKDYVFDLNKQLKKNKALADFVYWEQVARYVAQVYPLYYGISEEIRKRVLSERNYGWKNLD